MAISLLVDEGVPPDFCGVLGAFGHETHTVKELGLLSAPDALLVRRLGPFGLNALFALDHHREAETWAPVMEELANGRGRLVRLKLGSREVPTIPVLTRLFASHYEELSLALEDPRAKLIQVGREIRSQRLIPTPRFKVFNARQVGAMAQQAFDSTPSGELRKLGSPRMAEVSVSPGIPRWLKSDRKT